MTLQSACGESVLEQVHLVRVHVEALHVRVQRQAGIKRFYESDKGSAKMSRLIVDASLGSNRA